MNAFLSTFDSAVFCGGPLSPATPTSVVQLAKPADAVDADELVENGYKEGVLKVGFGDRALRTSTGIEPNHRKRFAILASPSIGYDGSKMQKVLTEVSRFPPKTPLIELACLWSVASLGQT